MMKKVEWCGWMWMMCYGLYKQVIVRMNDLQ